MDFKWNQQTENMYKCEYICVCVCAFVYTCIEVVYTLHHNHIYIHIFLLIYISVHVYTHTHIYLIHNWVLQWCLALVILDIRQAKQIFTYNKPKLLKGRNWFELCWPKFLNFQKPTLTKKHNCNHNLKWLWK